jgi:glycosyltransferase involved in cell wall biosynthesis
MQLQSPNLLNILILLNRIPYPLNDGGAIGAYNFVKGYAQAGCKVTILAMNTSKHFVEDAKVQEVLSPFGIVRTVFIDNRIKPVGALLNLANGSSYVIERFVSKAYKDALVQLLNQQQFDIVHIDGLPPAAYIDTVRAHSKAKVSMRAHNVEHVIWQRIAEKEGNPLKKWYVGMQAERLKQFEIKAINKCDVVMAISNEDEQTIKRGCPNATTLVVPAGMDISEQIENENYNASDLFFIGSFDWMPNLQGVDWFIANVWNGLVKRFPSLQLSIAGKKMPDSIYALKSANLMPVGEVPDAKQFMLQHGVMVVPIVSGSGIRIKILEGMALGKTIIATPIAAEGLGLTDGENILIADSEQMFIDKLDKCLQNADYCRAIGANAHMFALANYRNKNIFSRLVQYYTSL